MSVNVKFSKENDKQSYSLKEKFDSPSNAVIGCEKDFTKHKDATQYRLWNGDTLFAVGIPLDGWYNVKSNPEFDYTNRMTSKFIHEKIGDWTSR
jgi:hypothetical protein